MSIENNIASIAKSLERIATALENGNAITKSPGNVEPKVVAATAPVAPAPVVTAAPPVAPVTAPVVAASPSEMPAVPLFAAAPTPAAPTTPALPFSDGKGLVDYVMGAYKALGPEKGANIQGVLVSLGYQNINDVKPEHYAALHAGVEALK